MEVTPSEMHFLMGLTDEDFQDLTMQAANHLGVILLPGQEPYTTRVKVVR